MIATGFVLLLIECVFLYMHKRWTITARFLPVASFGSYIGLVLVVLGLIKWMWRALP